MQRMAETLRILADGEFHSGEHLARSLNISRGTVWKEIDAVRHAGLDVYAVRGKGYRLTRPFELLDHDTIVNLVNDASPQPLNRLDIHWSTDSTNARLMTLAKQGIEHGHTCIAERQTRGRGRRGRTWQSPIGGNIYLSQYWKLTEGLASAQGVSLAAAVALVNALRHTGLAQVTTEVGVKWPNDIVYQGKKLAGILLEISGEASGPCHIVVGVGVNLHLPPTVADKIDQPWTDLQTIATRPVSRNALVANIIIEFLRVAQSVEAHDLRHYLNEWRQLDCFHGKSVTLHSPKGDYHGVVRGIDDTGALQLAHNGQLTTFHSGEVSLRSNPAS